MRLVNSGQGSSGPRRRAWLWFAGGCAMARGVDGPMLVGVGTADPRWYAAGGWHLRGISHASLSAASPAWARVRVDPAVAHQ